MAITAKYPAASLLPERLLTGLLLLACLPLYGQGAPDVDADTNWVLVESLSDEFNDSVIDPRKWTWAPPWGTLHGQPETSQCCLTNIDSNRREEDGVLKLVVTQTPDTCFWWDGTLFVKPYSAGALYSNDTIRYGYFEIRMRIPDFDTLGTTAGFGPNFWMWHLMPYYDNTWTEIDIYEFDGSDNTHTCNVHYEKPGMPHWTLREPGTDGYDPFDIRGMRFDGEWHVFACEWSEYQINFYHNGEVVHCTDRFCSELKPMNFVLDVNVPAINFGYRDMPGEALFPYVYEIDYIRAYQYRN